MGFTFYINNEPIYVKGSNWVPVDVLINVGDEGTAYSGGIYWSNPDLISKIRKWVADGHGFIGVGEPSAFTHDDTCFALNDVLGVDKEKGFTLASDKYNIQKKAHFITDNLGEIDYGEGMKNIYALNGTDVLDIEISNRFIRNVNVGEVKLAANTYFGGRGVYIAGLPYNYPIYFHCNTGANRTGSLAYFINGLLGVSYEDLVKDFKLTSFSVYGNRFRSKVEDDKFVHDGEFAGIYQCDTANYVAFGKLHELISTNYAQENGELCSAIEYYLKKVCGITDETIKAVRRNMLGKDVDFDEVVVKEDNTFSMKNGNLTLFSGIGYEKGKILDDEEIYKFYTTDNVSDHYINNNVAMIYSEKYTKYHFEVYVPSNSAKWNTHQGKDEGCQFHFAIKITDTNHMQFGTNVAVTTEGSNYHLETDKWMTYELDISQYDSSLKRFAIYMPYATPEIPSVIYLRNIYVY